MDCFLNYIGLRDCSQVAPDSGFYINDMSGMSIKRLDNISDAERKNYIGVWNRVQARALLEMSDRIRNKFLKFWKSESPIETVQFGYFDGKATLELGTRWKGLYLFYYPDSWTVLNAPYIEAYSNAVQAGVIFKAYDLNTNQELLSVSADLIVGYNKVSINLSQLPKANSPVRIFIGYDSSITALVQTNPNYLINSGYGECPDVNNHGFGSISVQDVEIESPFLYTNITGGVGSGVSLNYNIECSLDAFICSQRHLFKYAWSKLLCAEIYKETLDSDRVNFFTTFKQDRAEQEMQNCMNDFNSSISDLFESMTVPSDGICFECNEQVKAVYGRP